jgi:membrane fusion protein (multidrug efflux system)
MNDSGLVGLLRPGMSVVPTIDTKATVLAERNPGGGGDGSRALGKAASSSRAG